MPIFNNKSDEDNFKKNRNNKNRRQKDIDDDQSISQIIKHNETFAIMLDTITDGVVIINPDGYIIQCNKVVERIMEFDPGEAIGKHVSLIYTQWKVDSVAKTTDIMDKIFSEKKPFHTENTVAIATKKHHKRNVDISVTPILVSNDQCLGYIITCQDKTDTVRMEEEIMISCDRLARKLLSLSVCSQVELLTTSTMC